MMLTIQFQGDVLINELVRLPVERGPMDAVREPLIFQTLSGYNGNKCLTKTAASFWSIAQARALYMLAAYCGKNGKKPCMCNQCGIHQHSS